MDIDRSTARHLLLTNAQESLAYIRRQWTANHALTAAEWDVLIEYMKIATEEDRAEPSIQRPAIPSRTSYLAVLDAFEAVYRHRVEHDSPHTWAYFGNLGGFSSRDTPSETDADQRDRTLLAQIARARADLQAEEVEAARQRWAVSPVGRPRGGRRGHDARSPPHAALVGHLGTGRPGAHDSLRSARARERPRTDGCSADAHAA